MHVHRLYGLVVAASRPLPAASASGPPDIVIHEHPFRRPSSLPPNPQGYSYEKLSDGAIHVSWSDLFDFLVSEDGARIDVFADAGPQRESVYTYLITQIISVALLQKGIESLHASAVAIAGKAIVLVGDSGYGKSTLTAALIQLGAQLITDDLLVLQERAGSYEALPGARRLKLAPETAALVGISNGMPMMDGSGKFVYALEDSACVNSRVPVERIVLLAPLAARPLVEPVSLAEATRALLGATFNPLHTEPDRLTRLLHNAERIARGTRIVRLHVPRDLPAINRVATLITSS
ncbi:MAG TPA: hypothetical protein VFZ04_01270 [Longimicrobiales bacterium]